MKKPHLELQLQTLPELPGVYRYYDKDGTLLYVGKAKNLKKRVTSYFTKNQMAYRTRVMITRIHTIETTLANSEYDALLLENSLIKEHQPRFNIQLKDDKSYPYICIKSEDFPRIFMTRKKIPDGSEYFGPYAKVKPAKILLDTLKNIYKIRSCNLNLNPTEIQKAKYKVCLEYHIKNCLAPCEGLESEQQYLQKIEDIRDILKGDFKTPRKHLEKMMIEHAEKLEFEKAHWAKIRLQALDDYQAKSTVVNPQIDHVDVFGIYDDETAAYVNYFKLRKGSIVQSYTTEIRKIFDETKEQILERAIIQIRNQFDSSSKEIFLPFHIQIEIPNVTISIPKIGDKKRILQLSEKNAREYRLEKLKQIQILDPERHTKRLMSEMKKTLNLPQEPRLIEGFDNSNIQGTNPVGACVVFRDGKPSKKDYRIFHINTVEGPDDFATMEEVIYRRYRRKIDQGEELPQLILIDGGKGQLSSALKSLKKLGLYGQISIISIAKKLEEIFFPNDPIPLYLDKRSETLKILQQVRDEAHRFGLHHHRIRRKNNTLKSELDHIPGIGPKTIQTLLQNLKSVKKIKETPLHTLEILIGKAKAIKLFHHLHPEK